MTRILPLVSGGADPAAVAGNAIIHSKVVSGVTQAFITASDGSLTQVSAVPTGTFLGRQIFTAGGTYTPTVGTKKVRVRMAGGGGGVGGGGTQMGVGGGGWSGTFLEKFIDPGATITGGTVTIGAAGAAGASGGGNGGTGGDTAVTIQATTYTAKGGAGGLFAAPTNGTTDTNIPAYVTGSTAGDFNVAGPPDRGMTIATDAFMAPGRGGSNPLGGGGFSGNNTAGVVGTGYGAGGSGGSNYLTANQPGGAGTAGLIVIDEYT